MLGYLTNYRNNGLINYETLAKKTAERNSVVMGIPGIALEMPATTKKGMRQYPGYPGLHPFLNYSQLEVLRSTPFSTTIFTDADFLINSQYLKQVAESVGPSNPLLLLGKRSVYDNNFELMDDPTSNLFPFWSTVLIYHQDTTPNSVVSEFFREVERIRDNWLYIATKYKFSATTYRNDFAFSLAIKHLGLPHEQVSIPESYRCLFLAEGLCSISPSNVVLDRPYRGSTKLDVHAMNKKELLKAYDLG